MRTSYIKTSRLAQLRIIVLAIVASGLFACGQPPQETFQQPNIILVMTDDQGWGQIGSHGGGHLPGPGHDAWR